MMDDYLAESDVAKAVMGDIPADVAVNRASLRYAVQQAMFCPRSGGVLDIKTAVYWSVRAGERTAGECVAGTWWDEFGPKLRAALADTDDVELVEVLDGRELFGARKAR